jgi:RNA polymerase sigma factor (sigma-70 family)
VGGAFERLTASELDRLDDAELVEYVRAAREAGDREAERDAIGVLVFGFWPQIEAWVRISTPEGDVEDVVGETVASLMRASFEGKVVGQFGAFARTIAKRRVADYLRERERRIDADPLASDLKGDDERWGEEPSSEADAAEIEVRQVIERVLAGRSDLHREVIRLYGPNVADFLDLSGDETAARINGRFDGAAMTVANVHQIWKRFKNDLERELRADG